MSQGNGLIRREQRLSLKGKMILGEYGVDESWEVRKEVKEGLKRSGELVNDLVDAGPKI